MNFSYEIPVQGTAILYGMLHTIHTRYATYNTMCFNTGLKFEIGPRASSFSVG